MVYFVQCMLL